MANNRSRATDAAEDARRDYETQRKLEVAVATMQAAAESKRRNRAWGRITVELVFQEGYLKILDVTNKDTVADKDHDEAAADIAKARVK